MKLITLTSIIITCTIFFGCDDIAKKPIQDQDNTDNRPKDEIHFLKKVQDETDASVKENSAQEDLHIAAFNKYAIDSLKKVKNWELIVTGVDDDASNSNSFAKALFDLNNNPVYNLMLAAPIEIDRSVDTIAISNRVDFTYTILKKPKGDTLKQQLTLIQQLKKGDTVIVSGALTHLDNLKVDFSSFYNPYETTGNWNVDFLITDIHKKTKK